MSNQHIIETLEKLYKQGSARLFEIAEIFQNKFFKKTDDEPSFGATGNASNAVYYNMACTLNLFSKITPP